MVSLIYPKKDNKKDIIEIQASDKIGETDIVLVLEDATKIHINEKSMH